MFSAWQRSAALDQYRDHPPDLIVIGGGATGAGILLDAASRGLRCLLLEQEDYAWGTSSRSTKLIHGGLRYLKQLEINLVREVGRERAILHANAPHLVHPEELLLPIVEAGSLGKYTTPVGLWMYEKLAGVPREQRYRNLSRDETCQAEPLLHPDRVLAGAIYREYRTDDARLVASLLHTAAGMGGGSLNYCRVEDFLYAADGSVCGVRVSDRLGRRSAELRCKVVVNAAGPWCDEVRKLDGPVQGKHLQLTKGVHLVFDRERFPIKRTLYFDVPGDNRMVFAVRRGRSTYLGTTDTLYSEDIGHPRTSAEDVSYLLSAANQVFPSLNLTPKDILSSWAGLRPLIHEEGKDPSELSRKDEVFSTRSGLISIAGGKLTGYRTMALRVMDMVMARLAGQGIPFRDSATEHQVLSGGSFNDYAEVSFYASELLGEGRQVDLLPSEAQHLVYAYGRQASVILEKAYQAHLEESDPRLRLLKAELDYGMEQEGVCTLSDFLIRRSGRLYFDRPALEGVYPSLAEHLAGRLELSREKTAMQVAEFEQAYFEAVSFPQAVSV
jgi:glycerol-3-phosphate dehydrogenase